MAPIPTPAPVAELPPPLVDSAEIARRYSVTSRHVTSLAEAGTIPAVRVGARWRFDPAEVHAALTDPKRRTRTPSAP